MAAVWYNYCEKTRNAPSEVVLMKYFTTFVYKTKNTVSNTQAEHTNQSCELVFYLKGSGYVETEGKRYDYRAGDIILVPSGVPHTEVNEVPHMVIVVGFKCEDADLALLPRGKFTPPEYVKDLLKAMLDEKIKAEEGHQQVLCLQTEILITYLSRLEKSPKKDGFASLLPNIESFIDENIAHNISLDDFAHAYHYSTSRFRHLFTEKVGISPKQYVIKKRLEKAKELLKTTDKNLTEIAMECGFYDSSQFSRIFKNHIGVNPSEARKALSKTDS